jgi:predicted nucleic-acid-binding protein
MIGLDTNVLVRLVVNDDPKQVAAAAKFIAQNCSADDPAFINTSVLCEMVWTLEQAYGFARVEIAKAIGAILGNGIFAVEAPHRVKAALERYSRQSVDLADLLIGGTNLEHGCRFTVTFDRKAAKLDGFRLLA